MRTKHLIKRLKKIGFPKSEAFRLIRVYRHSRYKFTNAGIFFSLSNAAKLNLAFLRHKYGFNQHSASYSKATTAIQGLKLALPDVKFFPFSFVSVPCKLTFQYSFPPTQ